LTIIRSIPDIPSRLSLNPGYLRKKKSHALLLPEIDASISGCFGKGHKKSAAARIRQTITILDVKTRSNKNSVSILEIIKFSVLASPIRLQGHQPGVTSGHHDGVQWWSKEHENGEVGSHGSQSMEALDGGIRTPLLNDLAWKWETVCARRSIISTG